MKISTLLHFDGANNSTSFADATGKTWTATGNARISTAQSVYGGASGVFDGAGDYIGTSAHDDFDLTGDFTIDCRVRVTDLSAVRGVLFIGDITSNDQRIQIDIKTDGSVAFYGQTTVSVWGTTAAAGVIVAGTWHRLRAKRSGDDITMEVDGVIVGSATATGTPTTNRVCRVGVARNASAQRYMYGYVDELRIVKGAAISAAPPDAAFTLATDMPSGTPELPVSVAVWKMGTINLPVSVAVNGIGTPALPVSVLVASMGVPALPVSVLVAPMGRPSLPISVMVQNIGQIALPISVRIGTLGTVALAVNVQVVPAAILSGAESVCVRFGESAVWVPVVRLDGVDITAQTLGEIRVEAEEGAARIAELTIRPTLGTSLYLPDWTGRALTVDVADNRTGTPRWPMRLFTGVVDTPALDLNSRTLSLSATDDLQGVCDGMTQAALAALIGGYYSPVVFDSAALGWDYANDRMSTRAAALDISPLGVLRVTPWAAKETADLVLDGLIGDGSLAVDLAPRSSLTNEVNINFGYRFPRVKAEAHALNFTAVDMTGFAQYILDEKYLPQRAAIEAAISKAGGTIDEITYVPLPDEIIAVGSGFWSPGPNDDELCLGFTATVTFDYAATIEEQHEIRVAAQKSIDAVGVRRSSMSGALEGEYPDIVATETALKLYKDEVTSIPPADAATPVLGKTSAAEVTLTPETNRAAASAAMAALIAIAKARIWASHRGNSVNVTVPLLPALDVDKTVAFSDSGVAVKGKVRRVVHRLDTDEGIATSEVTVALCSVAGVGIVHDEDATTAPSGTSASESDIDTAPIVEFLNGPAEDHSITVTFPAVDQAERNGSAVVLPASYAAPLVEDLFTVTI